MKQAIRLLGILLLISQITIAQNKTVNGTVKSSEDNNPLPGVSVAIKGSNKGTTTDGSGKYTISIPSGEVSLVFSFVGMNSQTIKIGNSSNVDVTMQNDANSLDEVVVTALGITQEKKALGYSVQEIKSDVIQNSGEQNILNAMQGKIAGAIITGSGGAPGAGTNIILRGITSLSSNSNNQPLFVVDGIIISNNTDGGNPLPSAGSNSPGAGEQFANTNRGGDVNPDDIESLSVLKGPAATALYGLRASNGAIIITTKKGKSGKMRVSVASSIGIDNVAKSPRIQERFVQGRFGEYIPEDDPTARSIFRSFGPLLDPNIDKIYDNLRDFYQTGIRNNNNLTIAKGGDKGNVLFSFGRSYQKGIIPFTDFARNSLRLAGTYKLTEKLTVSASGNYINSGGNRPPAGDKSVFSSLSYWPNSYDVNDYKKADGTQNNITFGVVDNPKYLLEKSPRIDNNNRLIGDVTLGYKLTSWLDAKYQITLDTYKENRSRQVDSTFDVGTQVKGWLVKENINFREINSNFYLTAQKSFSDKLFGSVMIGNSVVDSKRPDSYYERGEGWKTPFSRDISSYRNTVTRPYSPNQYRIVSYFADAKLNYKDMVYLNLTGRNDRVSTLPVQNNSFFYPSANLSFIFTEALPKNNFLSYGKLRASIAQVGKGTDPYITDTYFDVNAAANFPFNGNVPGYRRQSITADPNLKPERTTSIEVGTELRFLSNRLMIDATYFTMDSKDQIVNAPVTNASGYSRYYTNIGLIRNKGIELLVTGKLIKSKNFGWEVNVNWSKQQGTVIEMPKELEEIIYFDNPGAVAALKVRQGSRIGELWSFDYQRSPDGQMIIGTNGYPALDQTKTIVMGNAMPDWLGGVTNTFTWKGLSLGFLLEMRHGGDVVDLAEVNSVRNGMTYLTGQRYERVIFKGVNRNADGTFVPNAREVVLDDNFYRTGSQFFNWGGFTIQDGSWFRLRNANISYALPKNIVNKTPFKGGIRFNLTGTNLYLNTPFRGYDPEALSFGSGTNLIGFVGRNAPSTRSFQFGVNLNL